MGDGGMRVPVNGKRSESSFKIHQATSSTKNNCENRTMCVATTPVLSWQHNKAVVQVLR